jgi:hypothetical protein
MAERYQMNGGIANPPGEANGAAMPKREPAVGECSLICVTEGPWKPAQVNNLWECQEARLSA